MKETLELLDDLLTEADDVSSEKKPKNLTHAEVAIVAMEIANGKIAEHVGGSGDHDIKVNGEKREIKQREDRQGKSTVLARLGAAPSKRILANSEVLDIMDMAEQLSDENTMTTIRGVLANNQFLIWCSSTGKSSTNNVVNLSNFQLTTSMVRTMKDKVSFSDPYDELLAALEANLGMTPEDESKAVTIFKDEGGGQEKVAEISKQDYNLSILPALSKTSASDNRSVIASVIKSMRKCKKSINEMTEASEKVGLFWSRFVLSIIPDVEGIYAFDFVSSELADESSQGMPVYNVILRDVQYFTKDKLTVDYIDTLRPVLKSIGDGEIISVPPGKVGEAEVGTKEFKVRVGETVSAAETGAAKEIVRAISSLPRAIRDVKDAASQGVDQDYPKSYLLKRIENARQILSTIDLRRDASSKIESAYTSIVKIINDNGIDIPNDDSLKVEYDKMVADLKGEKTKNKGDIARQAIETVIKVMEKYLDPNRISSMSGSSNRPQENSGRSRPGPRLVETLSLLEDLLTP